MSAVSPSPVHDLLSRLTWLKHASFLYDGSVRIAFDPWQVKPEKPVDLILVSHGHYDHCDPEAARNMAGDGATVVAAKSAAGQLNGDVRGLEAGQVVRVGNAVITAVPAYNREKPYHPRGEGVGFLVAVDGGTIFHAGDTDDISETHGLKPDLALLPVGGTYTMDVAEAARAAKAIDAAVSVPMHFGFIVGKKDDGARFQKAASVPAEVLAPEEPFR